MKLWICGRVINNKKGIWEFNGVFSSEAKAIKACTKKSDFIGPANLDERLPEVSVDWQGAYYPKLEESK